MDYIERPGISGVSRVFGVFLNYSLEEATMGDFSTTIRGHFLEYIDYSHTYLVDGIEVPSVSQLVKMAMPGRYKFVKSDVLERAAAAGTRVHKAIEDYCTNETPSDLPELEGFKTLVVANNLEVVKVEQPLIIWHRGKPIAAGRCDLIMEQAGKTGVADIKRVSALNRQAVSLQLNLYRLGVQQCLGLEVKWLAALQLKEQYKRFVPVSVDDTMPTDLLDQLALCENSF